MILNAITVQVPRDMMRSLMHYRRDVAATPASVRPALDTEAVVGWHAPRERPRAVEFHLWAVDSVRVTRVENKLLAVPE